MRLWGCCLNYLTGTTGAAVPKTGQHTYMLWQKAGSVVLVEKSQTKMDPKQLHQLPLACMYTHRYTCTLPCTQTCVHTHTPTCVHMYMHTCRHACKHIHVYMHVCAHLSMRTCMHICMCTQAYKRTLTYTEEKLNRQTHKQELWFLFSVLVFSGRPRKYPEG